MSLPEFKIPSTSDEVRPAVLEWLRAVRESIQEDSTLDDKDREALVRLAMSDADDESLATLLIVFVGSTACALGLTPTVRP